MKIIIKTILLSLINLAMLYLTFSIHFHHTTELISLTDVSHMIELIFLMPIIIIGSILFVRYKRFRAVGIGLTGLVFSFCIYFFFYLNNNNKSEGEYVSIKLREAKWTDDGFYLNVNFNKRYHSISVSQEKCLNVDSVKVRIAKGFWGIGILTDDVKIDENDNCQSISSAESEDHFNFGHQLAQTRCFTKAIEEYTKCIIQDSTNADPYYHRGLMFIARKSYDNALHDFFSAAYQIYQQLDNKHIEFIDKQEMDSFMKKLFEQLDNHEYENLGDDILKFKVYDDFDTYKTYIDFCLKKLYEK